MAKRMKRHSLKYLPSALVSLVGVEEHIHWEGHKLKAAHVASLMDTFVSRYYMFGKMRSNLHSELMRINYGTHYNHYIKYLIAHGVISISSKYLVGEKSNTYELGRHWAETEDIVALSTMQPVTHSDKKHKTRNQSPINEHVRDKLSADLKFISLDPRAIGWLDSMRGEMTHRSLWKNMYSCRKLLEFDLYCSFCRYGRMHTNVTVIKREIRHGYLLLDGQHVEEIDISNSQPFFLYLELAKLGFDKWDGFDHDVLNESIYGRMLAEGNFKSRDLTKVAMYKVLFGRNRTDQANRVFKAMYPNVWAKIKELKHRSHKAVSHMLQRAESDFLYNRVVNRIMAELPEARLLTVHDSILCTHEYYDRIRFVFEDEQYALMAEMTHGAKLNRLLPV